MGRLTEKDDLGNWGLKGVRWEQLRTGHMITLDVAEKLYGALCKLKDYEDTKCSPEDVETLIEFGNDSIRIIARYVKKCRWIQTKENLPENGDYILLSFSNFTLPAIGRYEDGEWYLGDDDEEDTCVNQKLFVNAWMPLPEPYKAEVEEKPDAIPAWQGHYMDRFEKVE